MTNHHISSNTLTHTRASFEKTKKSQKNVITLSLQGDTTRRNWYSRVVFLDDDVKKKLRTKRNKTKVKFRQELPRVRTRNSMDHAILPPKIVAFFPVNATTGERIESGTTDDCHHIASWQTLSFPNCNAFHELNFIESIEQFLNLGEYRDVWKMNITIPNDGNDQGGAAPFVLKTLRTTKGFSPHRAELHRIDALVSERLSFSPYVANIYGYCGQSSINELAKSTGEVLRRGKLPAKKKLQFAIDVANAIATLHDMDQDEKVSLVHRDIKVSNFLISSDGEHLVVHDFNCARLMAWDSERDSPCGFYKPECVEHRSPEECRGLHLTHKIDIYSMGNVLYAIATSYLPYTFPRKYSPEEFSPMIINGTTPEVPESVATSKHPAIQSILRAMKKCLVFDPSHRPNAREIALELQDTFDMLYRKDNITNSSFYL